MSLKNKGLHFGALRITNRTLAYSLTDGNKLVADIPHLLLQELLLSELEVHILRKGEHVGLLGLATELRIKPTPHECVVMVDTTSPDPTAWSILSGRIIEDDKSRGTSSVFAVSESVNASDSFEVRVYVHSDDPSIVAYIGINIL